MVSNHKCKNAHRMYVFYKRQCKKNKRPTLTARRKSLKNARPKRYMNAFLCFCREERKKFRNGSLLPAWTNIHKQLGKQWRRKLQEESKLQHKGVSKFIRDSEERKQLLQEWRNCHRGLGKKWRQLDEKEKHRFISMSCKMKKKYEREMVLYKKKVKSNRKAPRKSKRKLARSTLENKQKITIKKRRQIHMKNKYISKKTLNIRRPKKFLSSSKKSENQMNDNSQCLKIKNSQSSDAVGIDLETNDGRETVRVHLRVRKRICIFNENE